MNFYINIGGQIKEKPIPIENLLEKGVTKKTYICIEGTEAWDVAENFRELDLLWQPKIKKKLVKDKIFEDNLNESDETIPPKTEEKTKVPNKKEESKIEKKGDEIEEENLAEDQTQEDEKRKKIANVAIKRMIVSGLLILLVFFGGKWLFDKESPQMSDEKAKPNTQNTPTTDINITKILQTELDKKIIEGIHDVSIGNHTDANFKFVEVIKFLEKNTDLNRIKIDSLAQKYKDKGNELCKSKNIDIAQDFFNHAAILSNTKPQICR